MWALETRRRRDIILFERLGNKVEVFVFIDKNIRNFMRVKIVLLLSVTEMLNSRKVFSVVGREIGIGGSHSKREVRCRFVGDGSVGFNW